MRSIQQSLRAGRPLWLKTAAAHAQRYRPLSGQHETAVAIVGGGMTGALIAHAFASAGIDTMLLEAGLAGRGSTAASSALLLEEPDLELHQLDDRFGRRTSRNIWRISQDSVREMTALLKRLRINCALSRRDSVYYASDAAGVERLYREFRRRTEAGVDAEWLSAGALRRLTGISARGAIRTRGSAQFDPYRACLGVLRAAAAAGARIFERSAVRRIESRRNGVRVRTARGTVDASRVIIATGYATSHFRPLAGRFRMYRTYVIATRPLRATERRDVGLGDVMVWDTERPYHYARWAPDDRLLLGGGDRVIRPGRQPQFKTAIGELRDYFDTLLPGLAAIPADFAWEGLFAMTPDSLPYIGPHPRYPRHWFALGYGGNGMTFGFLAAQLLLERWQQKMSAGHALFEFGRSHKT